MGRWRGTPRRRDTATSPAADPRVTATAARASSGGSCTSAGTCSTVAHTGSWTLAKSTDRAAGAVLTPGDVITYTLTATGPDGARLAATIVPAAPGRLTTTTG